MHLDKVAHYGKTQTKSPVLARARAIGLPKAIKYKREKGLADTLSCIRYRQFDLRAHPLEVDLNPPFSGCELYGI